jgi:hypothetical protein
MLANRRPHKRDKLVLTIPGASRKLVAWLGSECEGGGREAGCCWGAGAGGCPFATTWPAFTFWFFAKLAGLTGVIGVAGVGPSWAPSGCSGAAVAAALFKFGLFFFWAAAYGESG